MLRLLAAGKPNKAICRELDIEEGTVKAHIATIFRVLDVTNRTEAASIARETGLLNENLQLLWPVEFPEQRGAGSGQMGAAPFFLCPPRCAIWAVFGRAARRSDFRRPTR